MLILQNSKQPANIRHAIVDMLAARTRELRVASAYVTSSGSTILLNAVHSFLGDQAFAAIPKILITSFDFGLTEPQALEDWLDLENAYVRVAGADRLDEEVLVPSRAFHPKIYAFSNDEHTFDVLIGSANLTGRGLSVNTEVAWQQPRIPSEVLDVVFSRMEDETIVLTRELLKAYGEVRHQRPPSPDLQREVEPVSPLPSITTELLPVFRDEIERGTVDPAAYEAMWVQGEGLQGGSQNQLELPRGGHTFFGHSFFDYDLISVETIGYLTFHSGDHYWENRPLTWHGNNRMERLNLPTVAQQGFDYADSAVMFRRLQDGTFELIVAPWESDLARAWRNASAQRQLLFRLGVRVSGRLVGLI